MSRCVLITGAANGIGKELAWKFGNAGYNLQLFDVDREGLYKFAQKLKNAKISVEYFAGDVSDMDDVEGMFWEFEETLPDVVINNAGIGYNGELALMSLEDWEKLIEVNLLGPIYFMCQYLPDMIKRGSGHVVNVSSGQAFFRLPSWGAYAAIKTALGVISELFSFEASKYGIKFTTVYPFMVNTPFYTNVDGDTFVSKLSMKLLPYYSDSPEKVASKIFNAVQKNKRIELVNPINLIGVGIRSVPPLANVITRMASKLLIKGE